MQTGAGERDRRVRACVATGDGDGDNAGLRRYGRRATEHTARHAQELGRERSGLDALRGQRRGVGRRGTAAATTGGRGGERVTAGDDEGDGGGVGGGW